MQRDDIKVDFFHREMLKIDRLSVSFDRYVCIAKWSCFSTQSRVRRQLL